MAYCPEALVILRPHTSDLVLHLPWMTHPQLQTQYPMLGTAAQDLTSLAAVVSLPHLAIITAIFFVNLDTVESNHGLSKQADYICFPLQSVRSFNKGTLQDPGSPVWTLLNKLLRPDEARPPESSVQKHLQPSDLLSKLAARKRQSLRINWTSSRPPKLVSRNTPPSSQHIINQK